MKKLNETLSQQVKDSARKIDNVAMIKSQFQTTMDTLKKRSAVRAYNPVTTSILVVLNYIQYYFDYCIQA